MNNAFIDPYKLTDALTALRSKLSKAARKAVQEGGKIIANKYSANLESSWGHAKVAVSRNPHSGEYESRPVRASESPGVRVEAMKSKGQGYIGIIGPRKGAKARHAHLLEHGTQLRVRLTGRHPKGIGGKFRWVEIAIQSGRLSAMKETAEGLVPRRRTGQIKVGKKDLTRAFDESRERVKDLIRDTMRAAVTS